MNKVDWCSPKAVIHNPDVFRSISTDVVYVSICNNCSNRESKACCLTHRIHLCVDCLRSHLWSSAMTEDCVFATAETHPEIFRWRRV
jgi:hypothetical protein